MSRPRIIKLADGEVSLKGFTKERADEIAKLLTTPTQAISDMVNTSYPTVARHIAVTPTEPPLNVIESVKLANCNPNLTEKAFGLSKNPNNTYDLVEVLYDKDSKQSRIENVEHCGIKSIAEGMFKVAVATKVFK